MSRYFTAMQGDQIFLEFATLVEKRLEYVSKVSRTNLSACIKLFFALAVYMEHALEPLCLALSSCSIDIKPSVSRFEQN